MSLPPAPPPGGFGQLTPQTVLAALDAVGLRGDGRILQLNSYENRVWRVMLEDGGAVVAKFYRPGRWSDAQILEEHAFTLELAAAEVPVLAPLPMQLLAGPPGAWPEGAGVSGDRGTLLHWPDAEAGPGAGPLRVSLSPWLGGRDPEVESPQAFERLGRLIGRVHAVGARGRFAHRLHLDASLAQRAVQTLIALDVVEPGLRPRWESAARAAADAVERVFGRVLGAGTDAPALLRLHGDAHRGNLLERDTTLHLVDFDDACSGPAMQDLWLFLDGHEGESRRRQLDALLRGYEDFMEFDDAQRALIEPLRTLRLLRHSAWIAERWTDPAFPRAFPGFGSPNHWADQTVLLLEQADRMS
jgi:Ser/Thr protein kinase RdoA (MazF antagonist)